MTKITIKHIHKVRKKLANGKYVEYHYLYRGGSRFWSSSDKVQLGGPVYFQLYQEALQEASPAKGIFREIIIAFLDTPEFKKLAIRTQSDVKNSIFHKKGIDAKFGDAPIQAFNDPRIRKQVYAWRDNIAKASSGDGFVQADTRVGHLAQIVTWALDRGWLIQHHLQKIKKLYSSDRSEIIWTEEEINEFCAIAPLWLKRVLIVATETGLRPGDLHQLNRSHIKDTRIVLRAQKNGRMVSIPITNKLRKTLDETPSDQFQILVGSRGNPLKKANQFGQKLGEWKKNHTNIRPELHLYDARGTAATKLFAAGVSLSDLALFMGWSVQHAAKMVEIYCSLHPQDNDHVLIKLQQEPKNS